MYTGCIHPSTGHLMKKSRYTITAQLVAEKDEDLIMWLTSLSTGQRNQTIKMLLRRALSLPQPSAPVEVDPTDFNAIVDQLTVQQRRIADLSAEVEQMRQHIAAGVVIPSPGAEPPMSGAVHADDPTLARRAARLNRQNW